MCSKQLIQRNHKSFKILIVLCPTNDIITDLSDAAITHKHSSTTLSSRSASKASFNITIPKKIPQILAFLTHFQELRQQIFQNRPNCNQIGISNVSDGCCHCEHHMSFTSKKYSLSGSGIGFETVCIIFRDYIIRQRNL